MATKHFQAADDRIDARPTKELFIEMLTRDIALIPAIVDLVDNSADGARRLAQDGPYDGLWSRIEISDELFRIHDNCGGMTVEIAKKYAFRFGRPRAAPTLAHSIGEFGVGMKRAIFKLGNQFTVESATPTSRFTVSADVREWAKDDDTWRFSFDDLEENIEVPNEEIGTTVTVRDLHPAVAKELQLEAFRAKLREELRDRLREPISKRLAVTLNAIPVDANPLEFLDDERLAPAYYEETFVSEGEAPVRARFFAGLGPRLGVEAGWHIFCNGRLVVRADKTTTTGWGISEGEAIPQYHPEYNYFRGYAYFDCDDAGRLPWNTTKTGLDLDSPITRASRLRMKTLMRPIITFMNRLAKEKKDKGEQNDIGPLESIVANADARPYQTVQTRDTFVTPPVPKAELKREDQRITYVRPLDVAMRVKKLLKARSWKAVGEKTFDYFYNAEVGEDE